MWFVHVLRHPITVITGAFFLAVRLVVTVLRQKSAVWCDVMVLAQDMLPVEFIGTCERYDAAAAVACPDFSLE